MSNDKELKAAFDAEVEFEIWKTYFQLALDGAATALRPAETIVALADAIADAAAKKHAERRGAK